MSSGWNSDPLADRLRRLAVPTPDPVARERALHRAQIALGQSPAAASQPIPYNWRKFAAWAGTGGLVIAIAILIGIGLAAQRQAEETAVLCTLMRQVQATFQDQIAAVVIEKGIPHVVLSANTTAPSSDERPVLISVIQSGEKNPTQILTFSGRSIDLEMEGKTTRVQVLQTSSGGLVLAGDHFVWDSRNPRNPGFPGYRIEGRLL